MWDTRYGSKPIKTIKAHPGSTIHALDWSHRHPAQLLSGSVDQTVKIWEPENSVEEAVRKIQTGGPVKRVGAHAAG